jgi:hypothetical protein
MATPVKLTAKWTLGEILTLKMVSYQRRSELVMNASPPPVTIGQLLLTFGSGMEFAHAYLKKMKDHPWANLSWHDDNWTMDNPVVDVVATPKFILPIKGVST